MEEERQLLIVPDKDAIHSVFMRSVPMGCVPGIAPEWDRISYSPGMEESWSCWWASGWSVGQSFSPLGEKMKRELVRLMDSVGELQKQQTGTNVKEWTGWWLVSVE